VKELRSEGRSGEMFASISKRDKSRSKGYRGKR
jgi:hypothetical protein